MKPFFSYLAFFLINLTIEAQNDHVSSKFSSKRASFHSRLHKVKSLCFFTFPLNVLSGVFYSVEDLSQESWSGFGADDRRHCNLNSKSDATLSHWALRTPISSRNISGGSVMDLYKSQRRRSKAVEATTRCHVLELGFLFINNYEATCLFTHRRDLLLEPTIKPATARGEPRVWTTYGTSIIWGRGRLRCRSLCLRRRKIHQDVRETWVRP